jgi:nucleotide-binding universal stress UspA family protein
MFSHILVTLDGSAYSERALAYVLDLAEPAQARVTLLAVVTSGDGLREADAGDREAARVRTHRTYLEGHAAALRNLGIADVTIEVRTGLAATTITQTALELGAGLIMMSTQGLGAEQEQALGSVALKVLSSASCPVFMVRIERPQPPQTPAEETWQSEGGGNVG